MIDVDNLPMSSSCATEALYSALVTKDWRVVKRIIRQDMYLTTDEEQDEVFRILKKRRLNTTMSLREVLPSEIKCRDLSVDPPLPGRQYLVRYGEALGVVHFYASDRTGRKPSATLYGTEVTPEKADDIFEVNLYFPDKEV